MSEIPLDNNLDLSGVSINIDIVRDEYLIPRKTEQEIFETIFGTPVIMPNYKKVLKKKPSIVKRLKYKWQSIKEKIAYRVADWAGMSFEETDW